MKNTTLQGLDKPETYYSVIIRGVEIFNEKENDKDFLTKLVSLEYDLQSVLLAVKTRIDEV